MVRGCRPETRSSVGLCGAVRRPEETVALEDGRDGLALLLGDRTERDGGKAVADPDGRARGLEGGQPVPVSVQHPQVHDFS